MNPPNDRRPALQPPQFGLGTLMIVVALLCATFALLGVVGPYGALALILFALAVFAHIAGNAIGTRLRDLGSTPLPAESEQEGMGGPASGLDSRRRRTLTAADFAPTTQLSERRSLGLINIALTGVGVCVGGFGGGVLFLTVYWDQATPLNIGVGVLACAILGGIGAFALAALGQALLSALAQATEHDAGK